MTHRFGHFEDFAIEVGQVVDGTATAGLRIVEMWAAGRELCCDDNHAYVPNFSCNVENAIASLLSERDRSLPYPDLSPEDNHRHLFAAECEDRRPFRFLNWGPTTDNVLALLFRCGLDAVLTFEFWRETHPRPDEIGQVYVARLPERELLLSLHQAACVLRSGR